MIKTTPWKRRLAFGLSELLLLSGLLECFGTGTNRIVTAAIGTNAFDCAKERVKAQKGDAKALVKVAQQCWTNVTEMFNCYQKAAELGDREGQFGLGDCYANGDGVAKDLKEAVKWYRKAAE